ncbi:hypothetical protein FLA4_09010 [Candidatus Rickettsia kotlanii]|nr:hypothetical protein FLA4_09010 [Candidatus Rickettsia kotlanii]BDU61734.1 hypothetical protein HM2_09020 [Candidatus Rickettsia kotlanii]
MMNQPINNANYRLPDGSTVLHNAARIGHGLIMNPEFYSDDVTREKLIEKLFNYNINDNNLVIAPVTASAPVTNHYFYKNSSREQCTCTKL